LVPISEIGVEMAVAILTGDDGHHWFSFSLQTKMELERDTSSRSSEARKPNLLEDSSSVSVLELFDLNLQFNV